ncbi:MAG: RluA family pseudouridine synthase [Pseudomonadota bacterium]
MRDRLGLSWKDAKALVTTGKVHIGGVLVTTPQTVVDAGTEVSVDTDRRRSSRRPELRADQIIHLDEHLLIVDKPTGLVSMPPTPTGEPTVLDHLVRLVGAPVIAVHRLDHGTSGLMIFARTERTAADLDDALRRHAVRRTYLALCHGHPRAPARWDEPLVIRKPDEPPREVAAATNLLSARPVGPAALLHFALETGRWHQVRLHAALHGHPLLGDRDHGDPSQDRPLHPRRLALHSHTLEFCHPVTGEELRFEQPLPGDLTDLLARLGGGC